LLFPVHIFSPNIFTGSTIYFMIEPSTAAAMLDASAVLVLADVV
jgi:hypothetical protein